MDKEQAGQFCKTHNGPALNCWIYSDFEDEKENQLYTATQSPERPLEDDITVMYDSDDEARSQQCKVASLCLFNKYFHGNCSNEPFIMVPRLYEFKRSIRQATGSHQFTIEMARYSCKFNESSFFSHTAHLWNFLPSPCFAVNLDLQKFRCNVNHYLLSDYCSVVLTP